jgi:hypothetical protein
MYRTDNSILGRRVFVQSLEHVPQGRNQEQGVRVAHLWVCLQRLTSCRLILIYLIPCHLVTTHTIPTQSFLAEYPRLQRLFGPLMTSIKRADLSGFDAALQAGEAEFVKRRIYLTLERGRDVVIRNVLRKVYIVGGFDPPKEGQAEADRVRRTRIPVAEFVAAARLSMRQSNGESMDRDEVECMIANMIYKVGCSSNRCDAIYLRGKSTADRGVSYLTGLLAFTCFSDG